MSRDIDYLRVNMLRATANRQDIRNAPGIKVDGCMSKISLLGYLESPLVTVDADRSSGWTDIVDVFRLREEMNRGLTVK